MEMDNFFEKKRHARGRVVIIGGLNVMFGRGRVMGKRIDARIER